MPYWRLSAFYFFYFASLGALVPFWGLYLKDRGFTALDIGQLMAILLATKIVAPNIWGWIADRSGRRMTIVQMASLLSMVVFLGVFTADGFWALALIMALFSFFWNASLPQVEAVTFNHLRERIHRYASIRLWGSVGFICTVAGLGLALEWWDTGLVPLVVWVFYLGIWLSSLIVPDAGNRIHHEQQGSILALLRRPEVLAFFFACFMLQASHGVYYAFYSLYLAEYGYSKPLIGGLWALGVVVEVLVFIVMHHLLQRWGARRVLIASLLLTALRWLLIGGFPEQLWILLLAQTLHAASFGTFHAAAIHLVHHYFTGRFQGRGQALYSSLSFGAGGALGSLVSGYLWTDVDPQAAFFVSAAGAMFGTIVAWGWVDRNRKY